MLYIIMWSNLALQLSISHQIKNIILTLSVIDCRECLMGLVLGGSFEGMWPKYAARLKSIYGS